MSARTHGPALAGLGQRGECKRKRQGTRAEHVLPGYGVHDVETAMRQFQRGQAAVPVYCIGAEGKIGDVAVIPQPSLDIRRHVRGGMNLGLFGADDTPSAFRPDLAKSRTRRRIAKPESRRVRCLIEPVRRRYRPDPDRLEKHLVVGINAGRPKLHRFLRARAPGAANGSGGGFCPDIPFLVPRSSQATLSDGVADRYCGRKIHNACCSPHGCSRCRQACGGPARARELPRNPPSEPKAA